MTTGKEKKIEITEAESALLDMWQQFAYRSIHNGQEHLWCGGLSALESAEYYLRQKRGLIKGNGQLYKATYIVKDTK